MPIVGENGSVHVEYTIPNEIKEMIDRDFLISFRNELLRIFDYWDLASFQDDGIPMNTGTSGWGAAFSKACIIHHKEELYHYWMTLEWYDSDIFDGLIADMMIEENVILDWLDKYTNEYLSIDENHIKGCCDCGKFYLPEEVITLSQKEAEDELSSYRCKHCQDKLEGKIDKKIEFNDDILTKLNPFIYDIISKELKIKKEDITICSKCNKIFTKDMGVLNSEGFICHYCNDHNNNIDKSLNSTDYYRECLQEQKIHWEKYRKKSNE